jgi:MraZ protein
LEPLKSFVGRYDRSLDTKSRVILPTRLRTFFNSGFLAPGKDGCIALWTEADFDGEARRQHAREAEGALPRTAVRLWFSKVFPFEADNQGRIAIPQELRDHAHISQEVLFVGVYDRVELWSKQVWVGLEAISPEFDGSPETDGS